MSRFSIALFLICSLLVSQEGHSMMTRGAQDVLPEYPTLPDKVKIGASFDYILDRYTEDGANIEAVWYGIDILYEWKENILLDFFLGGSKFIQIGSVPAKENNGSKFELESDHGLAYGLGFKADVFEKPIWGSKKDARFFISGGFRSTFSEIGEVGHSTPSATLQTNALDVTYGEWQVAFGWNHEIEALSLPYYFGIKYSDVYFDLGGNAIFLVPNPSGTTQGQSTKTDTVNGDDVFGVFIGTHYVIIEDKFQINVEGRFIDETAVSLSGTFVF